MEKYSHKAELCGNVIIVDAVINTGDTVIQLAQSLESSKTIIFATNVLSVKAIPNFDGKNLYTIRVSEKHFKGDKITILKDGKGPDTGERLFTSHFWHLERC
jgi:hypoxanthine phosphoribosyltransferase